MGVALGEAVGVVVGEGVGESLAVGDALTLGVGVGLVADAVVQPVRTISSPLTAPSGAASRRVVRPKIYHAASGVEKVA
ncbi:MAG: hypothetical protein E6I47_11085 [Chloroflexi bacterium]|nr:MAG: hypothetical protein E6I47_11085 [Chloroflexota bacterium]